MSINSYSIKKYYSTKQNNNYYFPPVTTKDILSQLNYNLNTLKFQKIQTDFSIRRASVAAIIRVVPRNVNQVNENWSQYNSVEKFLSQNWVTSGICEILYIRRSLNPTDKWSGDLAFPGGKSNPGESDKDTCERETMEEVGLDLSSKNFIFLGQLDQREIKSLASFNKKLMVLCPHIYLQISPATPPMHINADEIQSIHWVPLTYFMYDNFIDNWKRISYPAVKILYFLRWLQVLERSSKYYYLWKKLEELVLGKVYYGGILFPNDMKYNIVNGNEDSMRSSSSITNSRRYSGSSFLPYTTNKKKPLILWGITLGITSDLVDLLYKPEELPLLSIKELASPKFSHKDLDLIVKCFKNGMPWKKPADYYQQIPCRKPVISEFTDDTEYFSYMKFSAYIGLLARAIIAWVVAKKAKDLISKHLIKSN
ncbi:hypothetical protein BCR32DRAFT_282835 [Anaeromyces robustus]|uniref:Nudix hydrolase domain-containing protein n=1 Tax=Anaeromyces robustus TaxID=1754192 RepID=A0A1Y1WXC3_9FUNG|nr:hypothetical protein BCR32DRAFT_282835 [Anaeromyces robustus]|eukprot:ORX77856.1 hypothetical protein BCR32DRAFT_282835 [Anaeromyces robustus]